MHNHCQIKQREITPKVRKAELSFLYAFVYVSTKNHQNIPKGFPVTVRTIKLIKQNKG